MSLKTLYFKVNPCDIDRMPFLAPVGDWLASWASECPCCNSARVVFAAISGIALGLLL